MWLKLFIVLSDLECHICSVRCTAFKQKWLSLCFGYKWVVIQAALL